MIRKFLFSVVLLAATLNLKSEESLVRVSQSLSQVKAYAGGYFIVKIQIERRNLDSFFMIEQALPAGMEAYGLESQGALFAFEEGHVKYTWLRLPKEEEIQVMFKVKVSNELRGRQEFQGSYYYIQDEEKQIFNLPKVGIDIVEHVAASDTEAEKSLMGMVNNDSSTRPDFVSNETDQLEYRIQILSSTVQLNKDSIRTNYKLKERVIEENFNGLYKYTVGNFRTYEQARNFKDRLSYQKYIPFVIAYNRGSRITIGEAMQIANRKRSSIVKN
jgi:hypothetical protein